MKLAAFVLALTVTAAAQENLHDPKFWPKDWNVGMCSKTSPTRIQEGLIAYCKEFAPAAKLPACPAVPSPEYARQWNRMGGSYLEPLDCQWHQGRDPRLKKADTK